jgi:hypothetical protein
VKLQNALVLVTLKHVQEPMELVLLQIFAHVQMELQEHNASTQSAMENYQMIQMFVMDMEDVKIQILVYVMLGT